MGNSNIKICADFAITNTMKLAFDFDSKIHKHEYQSSEEIVDVLSINSILVHNDIVLYFSFF